MIDARTFCDASAPRAKASEVRRRLLACNPSATDADALIAAAVAEADLELVPFANPCIFDEGTVGLLHREDGILYVAAALAPAQRNWVAAHELGHFHLHTASQPMRREARFGAALGTILEGYSPDERAEVEADLFAAEFLCPGEALRSAKADGCTTLEAVAARLGIPVEVVVGQSVGTWLAPGAPSGASRTRREPGDPGAPRAPLTGGGCVLVEGGPGSGKTTLAALEIAALVRDAAKAQTVALCSRTHALAARTMGMVPGGAGVGVWSGTIASLAEEILRQHPRAGLGASFRMLDDVGAIGLIAANAERLPPSGSRPGVSRDRFARLYRTISLAKRDPRGRACAERGTADLLAIYDRLMLEADCAASSDVVGLCAGLLAEHDDIARHVAGRWRHLVVDDAEEATPAEAALIGLLALAGMRVLALTAPDHAAFRFRGADPDAMADTSALFAALLESDGASGAHKIALPL